ncbi:MAG: glycosyltransferase family 4 protein [Bacteroidetes bacterium]|nr:MAG: glycosyltransferase family 4 protein [Bacteroidota bacterium]
MPRVLRILNRLIIGGPSKNAVYLSRYMQPDFDTLLVIGGKEDHEQDADFLAAANNIDPTCIPEMKRSISPYNDWAAYNKLKKLIKEFKPDIVHTHAAKSGALGRLAAKHSNVPVIVHTFHGHIFHSYFNSVKTNFFIRTERYLAGLSDAIVAISDVQKKELSGDFKIAVADKFRVIPLGLDLDNFIIDQEEKRNTFRKEFGLDDDIVAIGIIGRLVPIKNHSLFIKGLKYILGNTSVKIKAFIIGDGESRGSIEQMANDIGIKYSKQTDAAHPHPLIFTSWRTDIDTIFAGLDIIALTSLNEGTPVSLIEAQAAGKPIVSTRVGGIADVVLENKTALLSEITDEKTFSDNLLQLVNDPALRKKFSTAGKDHVVSKFSYHRLVNDMSGLYNDLLERKNHHKK